MKHIKNTLQDGVKRNILSESEAQEISSRIKATTNLKEMAGCQLVVEAVIEDLTTKQDIFRELDSICPPETVLASNTSTLSVEEIGSATRRPDRFIGLHFFYHPAMNRLLELIFLKHTCPEAMAVGNAVSTMLGKTALFVSDSPGFAVNRFFIPWSLESIRLLDEGIGNIPSIDHVVKGTFGGGMGPFEFMNAMNGFSLAYMTSSTLARRIGMFYGPPAGLEKKLKSGGSWDLEGELQPETFQLIRDRFLGTLFFAAASLVNEGVATMVEADIGAKVGLRWKIGPFELMNQVGIDRAHRLVQSVVERNPTLKMPSNLENQNRLGKNWDIGYVALAKKGSVGRIIIKRPEVMNALNETIFMQLGQCLDLAEQDPSIRTIVLETLGKDFIAGADIGFFLHLIKAGRFDDLEKYGALAHEVAGRIENSRKTTIARVQGQALGGGLELALTCNAIMASERAVFGFPETGVGIYPGLGGMARSARKIGKPLAKYLVLAGRIVDARAAMDMGLIEHVSPVAELDKDVALCAEGALPLKEPKGSARLPEDLVRIKSLFADERIQDLMSGKGIEGDGVAERIHKQISSKAPLAVELANKIMDESEGKTVEEALGLERREIVKLFETEDALEGMQSVGKYRPNFKGK